MSYSRKNDQKHRQEVFERDSGICEACDLDCERLKLVALRVWANVRNRKRLLKRWPWMSPSHYSNAPNAGSFWQMDHILPVSEGGGERGLDNMRTLCVGCHQKETAALATRNAKVKRIKTKHMAWEERMDF